MDDVSNNSKDVEKKLYIEGHLLTVHACFEGDSQWSLSVQNEKGVTTHWDENFSSAQNAINTALKAINEEGVDEFMAYDYFGYLHEDDDSH
ncbi:hypothetical protein [Thiohalophilus sp.]|uniref:hypothetical protein n=1 Tax=Thiohalophilus sp. TaxID=3028392 RepID=UPI002ACE24C9|nr:hypothetical protein [Thiohalophilus sp.]MDZ7662721.1 hypothetical protein [Thiohalophilus sp.]